MQPQAAAPLRWLAAAPASPRRRLAASRAAGSRRDLTPAGPSAPRRPRAWRHLPPAPADSAPDACELGDPRGGGARLAGRTTARGPGPAPAACAGQRRRVRRERPLPGPAPGPHLNLRRRGRSQGAASEGDPRRRGAQPAGPRVQMQGAGEPVCLQALNHELEGHAQPLN